MFIQRFRLFSSITMLSLTCSVIHLSAVEQSMLQRALGSARSSWQILQDVHRTSWGKAGLCSAIVAGLSYRFNRSRLLWKICSVAASVAYAQAIMNAQYAKRQDTQCVSSAQGFYDAPPTLPDGMIVCTNRNHGLIPLQRTLWKLRNNVRVWVQDDHTDLGLLKENDGHLFIGNQVWPADQCSHPVLSPGYIVCVNRQHTFEDDKWWVQEMRYKGNSVRFLWDLQGKARHIFTSKPGDKVSFGGVTLQFPLDFCLHGESDLLRQS